MRASLKKYLRLSFGSCLVLIVVACASSKLEKPSTPYQALDPNSPEFIDAMLIQKSNEAVQAQQNYMFLVAEQGMQKGSKQEALEQESIDIQNYIGKPNTLLKALANRYAYDYKEVGAARILPTITVDVKNASSLEVLKQISYQVYKTADVILDKDLKVIRLIYKK